MYSVHALVRDGSDIVRGFAWFLIFQIVVALFLFLIRLAGTPEHIVQAAFYVFQALPVINEVVAYSINCSRVGPLPNDTEKWLLANHERFQHIEDYVDQLFDIVKGLEEQKEE